MKLDEFEDVLRNRLFLTEKTLGIKGEEYAHGDRLSNFKKAAILLDCTPERALLGFVTKHMVALADFVNELEGGRNRDISQWVEKLQDIICYMVLLEGIAVERIQNEKKG